MGRHSQMEIRTANETLEEIMSGKKKPSKKRADGAKLMMQVLEYSGAFDVKPLNYVLDKDRKQKVRVKINSVISCCSGETHFWCDSNVGRIRKPVEGIPKRLLLTWAQIQGTGKFVYV